MAGREERVLLPSSVCTSRVLSVVKWPLLVVLSCFCRSLLTSAQSRPAQTGYWRINREIWQYRHSHTTTLHTETHAIGHAIQTMSYMSEHAWQACSWLYKVLQSLPKVQLQSNSEIPNLLISCPGLLDTSIAKLCCVIWGTRPIPQSEWGILGHQTKLNIAQTYCYRLSSSPVFSAPCTVYSVHS